MTSSLFKSMERQLEALRAEGRARDVHAHPCAHCPSVRSPQDPESVEVRDHCSRDEKIESSFRCAWRREKACRGYADFIGVTAEDLA